MKYLLISLLAIVSCRSKPAAIPHPGEIWRDHLKPSHDVRVDSVSNGKVHYTILTEHPGALDTCSEDIRPFVENCFEVGEVKLIRDTTYCCYGDSVRYNFKDTAGFDTSYRSSGLVLQAMPWPTTEPQSVRLSYNIYGLYTKRQLDSAYRKGEKDGGDRVAQFCTDLLNGGGSASSITVPIKVDSVSFLPDSLLTDSAL